MKRIRLLILLSVLAVALPIGLLSGIAKASGDGSSISINQNAQIDTFGFQVTVGLRVRCPVSPLPGAIDVHVTQDPPETVVHTDGDALVKGVVCDGQTHSVSATVQAVGNFDAGNAYATATFTTPGGGGTASAARWIKLIVMPG
jgi:hypothetical protein